MLPRAWAQARPLEALMASAAAPAWEQGPIPPSPERRQAAGSTVSKTIS
jgi:hypothetical protein